MTTEPTKGEAIVLSLWPESMEDKEFDVARSRLHGAWVAAEALGDKDAAETLILARLLLGDLYFGGLR